MLNKAIEAKYLSLRAGLELGSYRSLEIENRGITREIGFYFKAGGRLSAQSNLMTFKWKPILVTVLFTVCFKRCNFYYKSVDWRR